MPQCFTGPDTFVNKLMASGAGDQTTFCGSDDGSGGRAAVTMRVGVWFIDSFAPLGAC